MLAFYQTLSNPARHSRGGRVRRTLKLLWTSALLPVCRTRNLVLALAFSVAALAWGATRDHAHADRKSAPAHAKRTAARNLEHTRPVARTRRAAVVHPARRTRTRTVARTRTVSKTRTASRTHPRASSLALRRARLELAERERIRYEERRFRLEGRPHLSRDTVHLRGASAVDLEEANGLPGAAELNESAASVHPFTETVSLHIRRGGMPAPLRGSLALLERQDERLEADGLKRIETEADLSESISHKLLVPIPVSSGLTVNEHLLVNHRYCRPWTARFLEDLAGAHEAIFHRPLEVSSAVRPATYQEHLERINGNAAPAAGGIVSPHMMGATIDIAKHGLSRREIAWMRLNLLALEEAGKIDVEEEFRQSCFHITVYPNYAPERKRSPAAQATPAAAPAPAVPAPATVPAPAKDSDSEPTPQADAAGN